MTTDEQQIRDAVATWMRATQAQDLDTVLSLMTDDVVFLTVGNEPMRGKAAYAAASKPPPGKDPPKFDGSSDIQEIQVHGEVAFMWSRLRVVVGPPGGAAQVTRAGHTLTIFRKVGGKWLLARDANLLTVVK